jgi:hypothetical protein
MLDDGLVLRIEVDLLVDVDVVPQHVILLLVL